MFWPAVTIADFIALSTQQWAALPLNLSSGETGMLQGTYALIVSAAGISIQSNVTRTASLGIEPVDTDLPAGKTGTLSTRTDDDTGVATLSAGHGVQTGDKADVFWADGVRYGMACTVAGNDVTLDQGAGDNLPTEDTDVVVSVQQTLDVTFDGDNLVLIAASASRRSHLTFLDAGGAVIMAVELGADEAWAWVSDTGVANPLSGNAVASIAVSNGDGTNTSNIKLTGLQYGS